MATKEQAEIQLICNRLFEFHGLKESNIRHSNYSELEIKKMIIDAVKLGFSSGLKLQVFGDK